MGWKKNRIAELESECAQLRAKLSEEKKNHQLTYMQTRDCVVKACAFVEDYLHRNKPDPSTVRIQVDVVEEILTENWYPHRVDINVRAIGDCE